MLALLIAYRYWILFPLAAVEGPIIAVIAGWLVSRGMLQFLPTFIILFFGDFLPDLFYFWVGHKMHRMEFIARYGVRFGITSTQLQSIEYLWHSHTLKSALFSKWAYGMSTPLLMSAGFSKLPLRSFLSAIIPVIFFQYLILLIVGYYFGSSYQVVSRYLQGAEWVVALGVLLFIVLYLFVTRFIKQKFLRSTQ